MNYTTKFDIGQKVWIVNSETFYKIIKCKLCTETGKMQIGEEEFVCPKCKGQSAHSQYAGSRSYISYHSPSKIGKIEIEVYHDEYIHEEQRGVHVKYMLEATGVGSGTVHSEEELFTTMEEAQEACDKANAQYNFEATGTLKR